MSRKDFKIFRKILKTINYLLYFNKVKLEMTTK